MTGACADRQWRRKLCEQFPLPSGDPATRSRAETVHCWYHQPDYFCPEPYEEYPSHMHIDLLQRTRGQGIGRRMMEQLMDALRKRGSLGAHLAVSLLNTPALGFYQRLGFHELARTLTTTDGTIYLGKTFERRS